MRVRRWAALLVGVLVLVAACGGAGPAEQTGADTVVVPSAFGPVEVPRAPQRVVALDGTLGAVLDAGRTPVGRSFFDDKPEWFTPEEWRRVAPVPVVWTAAGPDVEAIAALQPDLVVRLTRTGANDQVSEDDRRQFERLRALVPATVFLASAGGERVKDVAVEVSRIVGDGPRAVADRDAYQRRVADVRTRYRNVLARQRVAPLGANAQQAFVFGPVSWTGGILGDAGIPLPEAASRAGNGNATFFSFEQISLVGDATAVLYEVDQDGRPTRTSQGLLTSPVFRTLPAVAAGRTYPLKFYFADRYRTANLVLDQVEPILAQLR